MFSTAVHLCHSPTSSMLNRKTFEKRESVAALIDIVATLIDIAGLITAVVLGALAISGVGGLPIGVTGGNGLFLGGLCALMVYTAKNNRSADGIRRSSYGSDVSDDDDSTSTDVDCIETVTAGEY